MRSTRVPAGNQTPMAAMGQGPHVAEEAGAVRSTREPAESDEPVAEPGDGLELVIERLADPRVGSTRGRPSPRSRRSPPCGRSPLPSNTSVHSALISKAPRGRVHRRAELLAELASRGTTLADLVGGVGHRDPAVAETGRTTKAGLGQPTHVDRHRRASGTGRTMSRPKSHVFAVVLHHLAGHHSTDRSRWPRRCACRGCACPCGATRTPRGSTTARRRGRSARRPCAAADETVLATSRGSRMPSFSTLVKNLMRSVTAAMAGMATKGSRNGVSGPQKRPPSAVYG